MSATSDEQVTFANNNVLNFYKELPFNFPGSIDLFAQTIQRQDAVKAYPPLAAALTPDVCVLDVGCGAGWLSNSIAYHHRSNVTGIDFNPVAIERAKIVSSKLGLNSEFFTQDLFLYYPEKKYDVVVSLGVLHHTNNCLHAVKHVAEQMVTPGGHFFLGLYHLYGRAPFLSHFAKLKSEGKSDKELLDEYRKLHNAGIDETFLVSWFRDQVLHPHETQHTLKEIVELIEPLGFKIESTSLNGFKEFDQISELFFKEREMIALGEEALIKRTYYPGFFLVMAKKDL